MRKKILFITGTRADYGKLKSLMKAVEDSHDFELHIFVGGMHLLEVFGSTYQEVQKDGYENIHIAYGLSHYNNMSLNIGNTINILTGYVNHIKPDMIVVHGDRIDALAGAIVGALNNIIVSHIEGGEVSGTIDESIRHAVSKFSHLHFVSTHEAKKRLIQLGEADQDIFVIGSPDIDVMLSNKLPTLDDAKKRYGIPFEKYGILMYHPVTTEYEMINIKIKNVVDGILNSDKNYVVVYPNNDHGSEIILSEYSRFTSNKKIKIFPSLRFEYFLTFLKNADFMIGNSSAGIRETCIYGIPSIDIGTRQNNRYNINVLKNIQKVNEDSKEIQTAINNIDEYRIKQSYFGKGNSTDLFMSIINDDAIWNRELQKVFIDLGDVI